MATKSPMEQIAELKTVLDNTRKELEVERTAHEAARKELERANERLNTVTCVYCNATWKLGAEPSDHWQECPDHPARKERDAMREAVRVGIDSINEAHDSSHCVKGCQICDTLIDLRELAASPAAPATQSVKCDGNHAMPYCADPQCWQRD